MKMKYGRSKEPPSHRENEDVPDNWQEIGAGYGVIENLRPHSDLGPVNRNNNSEQFPKFRKLETTSGFQLLREVHPDMDQLDVLIYALKKKLNHNRLSAIGRWRLAYHQNA
jgi:hypothetical protein